MKKKINNWYTFVICFVLLLLCLLPLSGCRTYYKYSDWAEETFDPDFTHPQIENPAE